MRSYDLVVFGASGFTGRLAAAYLARHAPAGMRWAIAGRDRGKLTARGLPVDVIVADSREQASIDAMVASTRVILSTAGPFARYGTPVVDACVRHGTDYVDITGETFWVESLVDRYHVLASDAAVRIVPCCGFDSVPSDLGAFLVAVHDRATDVRAYFQLGGGGVNGGTIASVSNMVHGGHARGLTRTDVMAPPHYDSRVNTWVGPFFMAPTNTWVVQRSATLFSDWGQPYPREFRYREFLKYDPPLAAAKAIGASAAIGAFGLAMRFPTAFRLIEPLLPQPGAGPSESQMDRGWFSCEILGATPDGPPARVLIRNEGDAGNRSTVKMLCESALCLVFGQCTRRGGILTPATAFGDHLVTRLRAAGMTVQH